MHKFCDSCLQVVDLTEDGYCKLCGKHADNMLKVADITIGTAGCSASRQMYVSPCDTVPNPIKQLKMRAGVSKGVFNCEVMLNNDGKWIPAIYDGVENIVRFTY